MGKAKIYRPTVEKIIIIKAAQNCIISKSNTMKDCPESQEN